MNSVDLAVELAHDVRSPLGAIVAITELLENGAWGPVTSGQRQQLHVVLDAANGLSRLTTDIVNSARAAVSDGAEPETEFDVAELLCAVRTLVQPMAEDAGLSIEVRHTMPCRWRGRRSAITRVLLNLATNALKYTEQGGVECGARAIERGIEFYVSDTGGGMKPGALRAGLNWRGMGSGLGLALSERLLDSMGSCLQMESTSGVGCRFSFELTHDADAPAPALAQ